jgi:hypothetical protein
MDYEFNSKNKIYASAMYNFRNDKETSFALGYKIKPVYNADESEITDWKGVSQDKIKVVMPIMTIPVLKTESSELCITRRTFIRF